MSWTTDGSTELTAKGNRVECTGKCKQPVNAIWKDGAEGVKEGQHFWTIKCETLDGTGFCGGVTECSKLMKGPEMRALMFGKDLSNGGGTVLQADFGPEIKSSDTLGIFVDMTGENLQVTFQINGTSIGLAYDLPKTALSEVCPVVQFAGKGAVTIEKVKDLPTPVKSAAAVVYSGIEGPWEFSSGSIDPAGVMVSLQIAKQKDNVYTGSMNIVNTIQFKITEPKKKGDSWKADVGAFTKMAGDKEAKKLEADLVDIIKALNSVAVEGDMMTMKNKGGKMTVSWQRRAAAAVKPAVTTNPFMEKASKPAVSVV